MACDLAIYTKLMYMFLFLFRIWLFKLLGLIGLMAGAWFIPVSPIVLSVALYVGFVGAALFIFMQLWLLIDFATSWNSKW